MCGMHRVVKYEQGATALAVVWDDGRESEYDYLWLRDNCPTAFHPTTRERNFNLLSIGDEIQPASVALNDDAMAVVWHGGNGAGGAHESTFAYNWLRANDYAQNGGGSDTAEQVFQHEIWDSNYADKLTTATYDALMADDAALLQWLLTLQRTGLTLVRGMPQDARANRALEDVAERISHLRETNFGITFDVQSKPNPNNQAYTAEALPLHTDLPNQELPPGFQFLHCLQNDSTGGESTFVDGFAVADRLRTQHPAHFAMLSTHAIPFRFRDTTHHLYERKPVIALQDGAVNEINYNAHIATTFLLPKEMMRPYYLAYRQLMRTITDADLMIQFRLASGEMVVFDNRRVLHGRTEFNPASGRRHLRGCYVDRGDAKSKIRILQSAQS